MRLDLGAQSTLVTSLSCCNISIQEIERPWLRYIGQGFGFHVARALFCVDLEVRAVWADGDLGVVCIEGEGGDGANVELVDVRSHSECSQDGEAVHCLLQWGSLTGCGCAG